MPYCGALHRLLSSKCGFATLLDPHGGRPASAGRGALNGQLSSLDLAARRFVLRGTIVSYGGAEVLFSNGSAAKLSGYTGSLKVEGVLSADRALLLASRISFNN